jgi:hypothetical protein
VRFVVTILCWLVTTVALAVAVPVAWAEKTLVNADGYAALAQKAANSPALQDAMASELTNQVMTMAANRGIVANESLVHGVAVGYTLSPDFPAQFANANRIAHAWLFTKPANGGWQVDLAPMLADPMFQQLLSNWNIQAPSTVTVPVTATGGLRPGELQLAARWGPWASIGAAAVTAVFALLTLAAARRRGRALASLGISALLVGGLGWAGVEIGRRYVGTALNHTTGDVRRIADVMVDYAEGSMHQWLNLTLAAGGVLVAFGIIVTMLGSLRRSG